MLFPLLSIPDALIVDWGLTFEAYHEEGLGLHFAAIIDVPKGPFAVRRAASQPAEGLDILCHEDGLPVAEKVRDFLEVFGLDESAVKWRSPLEFADSSRN